MFQTWIFWLLKTSKVVFKLNFQRRLEQQELFQWGFPPLSGLKILQILYI